MSKPLAGTHDPAYSIILAMGKAIPGDDEAAFTRGVSHLAKLTGSDDSTVRKWARKREGGGTGGIIPHWHHEAILDEATRIGAAVSSFSFLPALSKSPTGHKPASAA